MDLVDYDQVVFAQNPRGVRAVSAQSGRARSLLTPNAMHDRDLSPYESHFNAYCIIMCLLFSVYFFAYFCLPISINKIASLGLGAPLLRPSCDLGWTLCFAPIKM